MGEDKYRALRELPFPVIAEVLGLNLGLYRQRKNGQEWAGPCCIHRPKKNSTSFSFASSGAYQCFSCGAKGKGGIDLCMAVRAVGFQEAVRLLEPNAGRIASPEVVQAVQQGVQPEPLENPAFKSQYEQHYQPNHAWLVERNLAPETLLRYGVGFYSNPSRQSLYKGKVLLRLQRFNDGATTGYLARDIRPAEERGADPKYQFPKDYHKALDVWGAHQLKDKAPIRVLYVVESPFSVMHFHQLGFPCVATMGWTVSPQQAEIIGQLAKGAVFLPDQDKRDEASQYCQLLASRLWVKFPQMPDGVTDPEQLIAEQVKSLT